MSLAARPGTFGSRFHNYLYDLLGLDFLYKAFSTTDLTAAIGGIRALGIRGCALSMPFKEAVIPLLDGMQKSASVIASVNTIVNDDGKLTGHNTDFSAVAELLEKSTLDPSSCFVLRGSGGMAKAVAAALHERGHRTGVIFSRNSLAGRTLAARYGFTYASSLDMESAPLLINATPIGMSGPEAATLSFPEPMIAVAELVFEVVAIPGNTPLLKAAWKHGRPVISGSELAVLQALEQFVLYTGIRPNMDMVRLAAEYAREAA